MTNLAKSGPEKKCFVSFASKSIFWFRHTKNCFTKKCFFLISFHKNGPIKKSPRVITDIIILEVHKWGFLFFCQFWRSYLGFSVFAHFFGPICRTLISMACKSVTHKCKSVEHQDVIQKICSTELH